MKLVFFIISIFFNKHKKDSWFASRKFDGVRSLCFIKNGIAEFKSREGNLFTTLQLLEKKLNKLNFPDGIFDGEICIFEEGKENFKEAVSQIKKKSGMIMNPRYCIFDYFTLENFQTKTSIIPYSERLNNLKNILKDKELEPYITIVEQLKIKNQSHLDKLTNSAKTRSWEGLILRKDCNYEGKRSNNMIKVKQFQDSEFEVKDIEISVMRFIINGKDTEILTLKNVIIHLNGNPVYVGSGFSVEEREMFKNDPSKIIGKIITVSYFEKTTDKTGKESLRFPTFKGIFDENDIDV